MAAVGPDDFCEVTPEEIREDDEALKLLSRVWPAGFQVVSALILCVHDGEISEESPMLTTAISELVQRNNRNEEAA